MGKKIVYVVYHDLNKEARSMELLNCCKMIGHVDIVTYQRPEGVENINVHLIDKTSPLALLSLISKGKKVISSVQPDIVVLHDNDTSPLIPYIKKHCKNAKIVYDSSELFIDKRMPGMKKSLIDDIKAEGLLIKIKQLATGFRKKDEKKYLCMADCVIAANIERAKIMKDYFRLSSLPIIFNNMHRIDDEYDERSCREKFSFAIDENKFNILFGGGISEERKTFDFINAVACLDEKYNLIIAGSASPTARKQYDELLEKKSLNNVHYVGFVTRAELRYLMRKSQASVVIFDKDSYNTLYCESGKCYESLFEGTPIIASENPPLKRLCENQGVGVSEDDYQKAIVRLYEGYDDYKRNVCRFIEKTDYESRILKLADEIGKVIM